MTQGFSAAAAQLVHLSGPERGRTRRIFGTTHLVPLEGGRLKLVYGQPQLGEPPNRCCRLARRAPCRYGQARRTLVISR